MICLLKASEEGNTTQINFMVENDLIKLLLDTLMLKNETKLILNALEILSNLLSAADEIMENEGGPNLYLLRLEKEGGIKMLESLLSHMEDKVVKKASEIVEEFIENKNK